MDRPRGDYVGSVYLQPDGKFNCNRLLDAAKAAATPAKVLAKRWAMATVWTTRQQQAGAAKRAGIPTTQRAQ